MKTRLTLASICYYKPWKCWEMVDVNPDAGFTSDCLRDIAEFLESLNK